MLPVHPSTAHRVPSMADEKIILPLNIWLPSPESVPFPWMYGCLTMDVSQDRGHYFFPSPKKKVLSQIKHAKNAGCADS